uniref:Basic helix-loop-helix transcription factor n=1 Tax=Erythranthe lewisii TaxID=69919 RepID=W8EG15_ERYLE|nr:basic helix-loop-helix transcription factor [Erythranthe lewisii]
MDSGNEKQNLRKKVAIAVRSIQWSYGIFWSISSTQPGALEWGEGYYNGDIKTRKTVQAAESKTDQLGLQRSEQLRELYESLSLGENNPQAIKRPTAALSPEDLTDAEWYFLVCMSFVFNADQGLPGRTLSKNQTIWLCNAGHADTKVFSRSLLAKSASIQTIVCFPYFGGVFELGATELVPEDPNLVQHVIASFLDSPSRSFSNVPNYVCQVLVHASLEEDLDQLLDCPNMDIFSPDNFSDDFADNLLRDESNLFEGDDISNCLNNSTNSSDCISQTHEDQNQECNNQQNNPSVLQGNNDDVHYQSVLSNLLKSSQQLIFGPYFGNGSRESSLVCWRKNGLSGSQVNRSGNIQQKLLKKVLVEVGKMHENGHMKQNGNSKTEADEIDRNHVLSERKRREKINERFTILGSLVPSGGKVDKISILDNTIEYLRELERKIEDLESTTQSKPHDAVEMTSDNYGPNKTGNITKKPSANKRKACEVEKMGPDNISVSVSGKDVSIELACCEKEGVLLEVMEAIRKLRMDTQNVHSSNSDGILSITIKAKYKGLKGASAGMITQALQKIMKIVF